MQIDRAQRGWAIGSLGIFAAALALYLFETWGTERGARGGSAIGLFLGVVGFGFMIFAAALGARKRVPTWRIGRAKAWMKGHLWLGLLSLPLILFHGGFHFGGTLTRVLMWLLIITVMSGVYGAALQHYIPKKMTADALLETIYDEIGNVRGLLAAEATRSVEALCGKFLSKSETRDAVDGADDLRRAGGFTALRPIAASAAPLRTSAAVSAGASAAVAPAAEILLLSESESEPLRSFYVLEIQPFLERPKERGLRLSDAGRAASAFAALQTLLPAAANGTLGDLEDICDEARQLLLQERLHQWLHGWLLLHIPVSLALILLGAVHAVMALRW